MRYSASNSVTIYNAPKGQLGWLNLPHSPILHMPMTSNK